MIRILQIMPAISVNNGMMSVILNYHRHVDRSKVQFDYLYFTEDQVDHKDEIYRLGGRTFCFGDPKISFKYLKLVDGFFSSSRNEYKAIHCHPIFSSEIFGAIAKKYGIRYIIAHSHSTKFSNKKFSAIRNYLINLSIERFATHYMACSQEASRLFGKSILKKDICILRNAIDYKKYLFNPSSRVYTRSSMNVFENEIIVGHIGRFSSEKNHKFLLVIMKFLVISDRKFKLLLVGDGNLYKDIVEYSKIIGLEKAIIFAGDRKDIPDLLSAMDVFVFPSLFEGVPISVIEAQASGLPCIISDQVTSSVAISNCKFLSIKESAEDWATAIINTDYSNDRYEFVNNIKNSEYNIENESIKLTNYYLNLF